MYRNNRGRKFNFFIPAIMFLCFFSGIWIGYLKALQEIGGILKTQNLVLENLLKYNDDILNIME